MSLAVVINGKQEQWLLSDQTLWTLLNRLHISWLKTSTESVYSAISVPADRLEDFINYYVFNDCCIV